MVTGTGAKVWSVIILTVILLFFLTSSGCAGTTAPTPSPQAAATTEPDLTLVKTWQGTGIKTTEQFVIQKKPWAIVWTNRPETTDGQSVGLLQIMVFDAARPGIVIAMAANTMDRGMDTSFVHQTGTFYLTINTAGTEWEVTVFEPR